MIERNVSKGIISTYFNKLERNLDLDVAIVGVVHRGLWQLIISQKRD